MGEEFRKKGVNMLLGPVAGPLGRIAEGGRNWEGFADDPYLSGSLMYNTVGGIQSSGVGACTKVSCAVGWQNALSDSDSTTSETNKRRTETLGTMLKESILKLCHPTLTTRPCTSCISGRSMMPLLLVVHLLCARISASTTRMAARTAKL
jgi:hypothetical protein